MNYVLQIHYLTNLHYIEEVYTPRRNILLSFGKGLNSNRLEFFLLLEIGVLRATYLFREKLSHMFVTEIQ